MLLVRLRPWVIVCSIVLFAAFSQTCRGLDALRQPQRFQWLLLNHPRGRQPCLFRRGHQR